MSTNGSSLDWSDLFGSRPLSSNSDEMTTANVCPKQMQAMTEFAEQMTVAHSLDDLSGKLSENLNLKDTYVIYSVGNSTLLMSSLDTQYATEPQLQLLDRHLLDVKVADPEQPLWPNPDILTMGMHNVLDGDVPCTSTAGATAPNASRRYHTKMRCVRQLGKKKRNKLHYK